MRYRSNNSEPGKPLVFLVAVLIVVAVVFFLPNVNVTVDTQNSIAQGNANNALPTPVPTVVAKNVTYSYDPHKANTTNPESAYLGHGEVDIKWDDIGIEWNFAIRDLTETIDPLYQMDRNVTGESRLRWVGVTEGHTYEFFIYPKGDRYDGPTSYRLEVTIPVTTLAKYRDIQAGAYLTFGCFEQDNNEQNGKEAISWRVLKRNGNWILVVSESILTTMSYEDHGFNKANAGITMNWENCSLREWLNNDFYYSAFTASEREAIRHAYIRGTDNIHDYVFLLSRSQAQECFSGNLDRKCRPTLWAERSANHSDLESVWWLIDYRNGHVEAVKSDGMLGYQYSDNRACGVRPAMWLDITALQQ